jgi:hypothetical protein
VPARRSWCSRRRTAAHDPGTCRASRSCRTPIGARYPSQLGCAHARGDADSPLLLVNHWIDTFPPSISRNQAIGGACLRPASPAASENAASFNLIADDFYERTSVVALAKRFDAGLR